MINFFMQVSYFFLLFLLQGPTTPKMKCQFIQSVWNGDKHVDLPWEKSSFRIHINV